MARKQRKEKPRKRGARRASRQHAGSPQSGVYKIAMVGANYRIQEWFRRLEQPGETMRREDVCFVIVQARHLIEASKHPENYRVASFYADWIVHTALDRSLVCFEVLRDITRVITDNMVSTSQDLTRQVSRIIGLPLLRAELRALFTENELPVVLFDYYENWKGFVAFLLWHVAGQPIGFPDEPKKRAKAIRDEMLATPRPHNMAVEALAIVNHGNKPHWMLQLSGDKKLRMLGAVDVGETAEVFAAPPV